MVVGVPNGGPDGPPYHSMIRPWCRVLFLLTTYRSPLTFATSPVRSSYGLKKISSETGSLTLAPDGIPVTSTRLFNANGLITMSGFDVGIA